MGVSIAELSRLEDSRRLEPDSLSNQIPHSSLGIVRQYEIYDSRMSTVWAAWHPKQIMGLYACKTSQVLPAPITGLEVREPNRGIGQRSSPCLKISSRMIVIVSVLLVRIHASRRIPQRWPASYSCRSKCHSYHLKLDNIQDLL